MKKRKNKIILVILILLLMAFAFLFLYSPYIISSLLPHIFNKYLNRELSIKKINYSLIKTELTLNDVELKTKEGTRLIFIKKVFIDFDFSKLIYLKFSVSSVVLEGLNTYFINNNNNVSFPEYISTAGKISGQIDIPFSIDEIRIVDSSLDVMENSKIKQLFTDINIFVPGINSENNQQLSPEIKGKFNNKEFNIKGKTVLTKDEMKNIFNIKLEKFNIEEISKYIPDIRNIKIVKGIVDADININFYSSKNNPPILLLDGTLNVDNLLLKDLWINKDFITNGYGNIKINKYDVFNNYIEIDDMILNKGVCNLYYSKIKEEGSTFFFKKPNIKKPFKAIIKAFKTANLELNFSNKILNTVYSFNNSKISIDNYSNFKNDPASFNIESNAYGLDYLKAAGNFILKEKRVDFDNLIFKNLDAGIFKLYNFDKIKSLNIKEFNGYLKIKPKYYSIKGYINLANLKIQQPSDYILINNAEFEFDEFNNNSNKFDFNYLNCTIGHLPLNNSAVMNDLSFALIKKDVPYTIGFDNKKISMNSNFKFINLSGKYIKDTDKNLNFKIKDLNLDLNFDMIYEKPVKITAGIILNSNNLIFFNNDIPVLKINSIKTTIDKIKYNPLYLNISNVTIDSPIITIDIKKDKKLYLLSVFDIKPNKNPAKAEINVDKINIINGKINFSDYSMDKTFNLNLNNLNLDVSNYPSTVYPEGKYKINCNLNERNEILCTGSVGSSTGIKGNLEAKNISLPFLSVYTNNYIGYSINSGNMNLNLKYNISSDDIDIKNHIELQDFKFILNNEYKQKYNLDLTKITESIKDNQGKIILDIPIDGKMNNPNIDFRSLFFDMFLKIVANAGKDITKNYSDFIEDGTYEIVEFVAGTDQIKNENILSNLNLIKEKSKDNKKLFLVESYVDMKNDTPVIKEQLLQEKMDNLTTDIIPEGSEEELDLLKKVYSSLSGKSLTDNLTNSELKKIIIDKITIDDSKYYALSYKRTNKIKEILIDTYNIEPARIKTREKNIFEKNYTTTNNCISIIKSGNENK